MHAVVEKKISPVTMGPGFSPDQGHQAYAIEISRGRATGRIDQSRHDITVLGDRIRLKICLPAIGTLDHTGRAYPPVKHRPLPAWHPGPIFIEHDQYGVIELLGLFQYLYGVAHLPVKFPDLRKVAQIQRSYLGCIHQVGRQNNVLFLPKLGIPNGPG